MNTTTLRQIHQNSANEVNQFEIHEGATSALHSYLKIPAHMSSPLSYLHALEEFGAEGYKIGFHNDPNVDGKIDAVSYGRDASAPLKFGQYPGQPISPYIDPTHDVNFSSELLQGKGADHFNAHSFANVMTRVNINGNDWIIPMRSGFMPIIDGQQVFIASLPRNMSFHGEMDTYDIKPDIMMTSDDNVFISSDHPLCDDLSEETKRAVDIMRDDRHTYVAILNGEPVRADDLPDNARINMSAQDPLGSDIIHPHPAIMINDAREKTGPLQNLGQNIMEFVRAPF